MTRKLVLITVLVTIMILAFGGYAGAGTTGNYVLSSSPNTNPFDPIDVNRDLQLRVATESSQGKNYMTVTRNELGQILPVYIYNATENKFLCIEAYSEGTAYIDQLWLHEMDSAGAPTGRKVQLSADWSGTYYGCFYDRDYPLPESLLTTTVDPVIGTPPPGLVSATQGVQLSSTPGAVIYYTLDGSDPNPDLQSDPVVAGKQFIYSAPIQINGPTTIKAVAKMSNGISGPVSILNYDINRDLDPPAIELDPIPAQTNNSTLNLSGTMEQGAQVTVNGGPVVYTDASHFSVAVNLIEGDNVITVVARDAAGNETIITRTVELDTAVPALTLTSPVDGFATKDIIVVNGCVEIGSQVWVNGEMATPDLAGNFSATVANLIEGPNTITVTARDQAGNETIVNRTVTLDTKPPCLTVDPIPDSTNQSNLTITGTVDEGTSVIINGTTLSGPQFSHEIILVDGNNEITITARDLAGNETTVIRTVVLDTNAPFFNLNPIPETINSNTLTVSGTMEEGVTVTVNGEIFTGTSFSKTVSMVEGSNEITIIAMDGAGNEVRVNKVVVLDSNPPELMLNPIPEITSESTVTVSGTTDDSALVSVNGTTYTGPSFSHVVTLTEGQNNITVTTSDAAGNTVTLNRTVTLDKTPPSFTIDPTPELTNQANLTISGTIEVGASVIINGTILSGPQFSHQITLVDGANEITITVRDLAGNEVTATRFVKFDSVGPFLNVDVIPEVTDAEELTVSGSVEEGSYVLVNGTRHEGPSFSQLVTLTEGTNEITIIAVDAAGNTTTENRSVILDKTPPLLSIGEIPELTNNSSLTITGTVEDGASVSINGTVYQGSTFFLTTVLVEGANDFNIVATDRAGNTTTINRRVILDTTPPALNVNPIPAETSDANLTIMGTVEQGAWVMINGTRHDGPAFSHSLTLVPGANEIAVLATDAAGNTASITRTVNLIQNKITDFTITPDPIRIGTNTFIQYNLSEISYVTINVYKESGEHVKTIMNNSYRTAGSNYVYWDTKDKTGALVTNGNYKFVIEAKTLAGVLLGKLEKLQKAARVPKVTVASDTPDPFNPLIGEKSSITYYVSEQADVTITILKGYVPVKTLKSAERQNAGTYTVTWDGFDGTAPAADAVYTYQIDTVSPDVPSFYSTYKGTTTVEKEAPSLNDITCYPDPLKLKSGTLSIRYNLSENGKVNLKILDSAGGTVRTLLNSVARTAGYNGTYWDGKNGSGAYVPEGTYTVVLSAVDNYFKPSIEHRINVTAGFQPAVTNVTLTPSPGPFDPNSGPASIGYMVTEKAKVTIEILKGVIPVRTIISDQERLANTAYSEPWDGKDNNGNILADGVYSYQITATSPTVAIFKGVYKGNITVEKENPRVENLYVGPNPLQLGNSLSITYNISEDSAMKIDIYKGTDPLPVRSIYPTPVNKTVGYNSAYWDGKDNSGVYVAEGDYTVVVTATDPFGKTGTASGTVAVGYKPVISNAAINRTVFNPPVDGNALITFNLDNRAKVIVTVLNGYLPVRTIQAGTLPAGPNTVIWNGKDDFEQFAPDANYTYQIEAVSPTVDTFKSTVNGNFTVEANNPVVNGLYTSPYVVKIGSSSVLGYQLSEDATVTVQVLNASGGVVRNFPAVARTKSGYYTTTWDSKDNLGNLITAGDYILKVTAADSFGKTGTSQLPFQAGKTPVISGVSVTPDPYDVSTGNLSLSYSLNEQSFVTVKIFDAGGKLWKALCWYKDTPAGSETMTWNGVGDNGQTVYGTYTYEITASSVIGNFYATAVKGTLTVTGPAIP